MKMVDGDGDVVGRVEGRGVNISFGEDLAAGKIGSDA